MRQRALSASRSSIREERCQKKITEQTAQIYRGRCVPCHRRRFAQALPRIVGYGIDVIRYVICLPFDLVVWGFQMIRVWITPLPFSRREVVEALTPVYGKRDARRYFRALRSGFLHGGCVMSPCWITHEGINEGAKLREDPAQLPTILRRHQRSVSGSRDGRKGSAR